MKDLPLKLKQFMADLADIIAAIDLDAIKTPGSFTPPTPRCLRDLDVTLCRLPELNESGSAGLKAETYGIGWCRIERNGLGLAWGVWVGTNDGTKYGHDDQVAGIDSLGGRSFIADDAPEALNVVLRVLTSPYAVLRGVSRRPDGTIIRDLPLDAGAEHDQGNGTAIDLEEIGPDESAS